MWPRLLGINLLETVTILSDEELSQHPEYNQGMPSWGTSLIVLFVLFNNKIPAVVLDVNRSLKRFPPGIEEADRPVLQDQLTRLIVRVLVAHPGLHYYQVHIKITILYLFCYSHICLCQGYHDVAITFLLVVGETIGYQIMEKLSASHLRQFMAPTMENTMGLLQLM